MGKASIHKRHQVITARVQDVHPDRCAGASAPKKALNHGVVDACLVVFALGLPLQACDNPKSSATQDRAAALSGTPHSATAKEPSVGSESQTDDLPSATFNDVPSFNDYPAYPYKGKTQLPDFINKFRKYCSYRLAIVSNMRDGVNFAGNMAIVDIGCGTECSFSYVADLRTGKIYPTPITLHIRQHKVEYRSDSKLLMIYRAKGPWRPEPSISDVCIMDSYIWQGRDFKLLSTSNSVGQCPESARTVHSDAHDTTG